jgi:hypothetical protein
VVLRASAAVLAVLVWELLLAMAADLLGSVTVLALPVVVLIYRVFLDA